MPTLHSVPELERRLREAEKEWEAFKREEDDTGKLIPWADFIEFAAIYLCEHGVHIKKDSWKGPERRAKPRD